MKRIRSLTSLDVKLWLSSPWKYALFRERNSRIMSQKQSTLGYTRYQLAAGLFEEGPRTPYSRNLGPVKDVRAFVSLMLPYPAQVSTRQIGIN